MIFRKA